MPACRSLNSEPVRARNVPGRSVAGFVFDIVSTPDTYNLNSKAMILRSVTDSSILTLLLQDGVLKKGEIVFPGARRVLALLKDKSVPFVLCTNGGGIPEHVRCEKLSKELETEVRPPSDPQQRSW